VLHANAHLILPDLTGLVNSTNREAHQCSVLLSPVTFSLLASKFFFCVFKTKFKQSAMPVIPISVFFKYISCYVHMLSWDFHQTVSTPDADFLLNFINQQCHDGDRANFWGANDPFATKIFGKCTESTQLLLGSYRGQSGRGVKSACHLRLVPSLRMSGAIPLLPHVFMALYLWGFSSSWMWRCVVGWFPTFRIIVVLSHSKRRQPLTQWHCVTCQKIAVRAKQTLLFWWP
jgi:hypothetical protein